MKIPEMRRYERDACAVFCKTREAFGVFSNMAAGMPLVVDGTPWRSSEALYQACRLPTHPALQSRIAMALNGMAAKEVAHSALALTRADWETARVHCMRWVLRLKAQQHPGTFVAALLESGDRPIVELSMRDDFWGAGPGPGNTLVGRNVLGRLLMQVRAEIHAHGHARRVLPPPIPDARLLGKPIPAVEPPTVEPEPQPRPLAARLAGFAFP